MLSIEDIYNCRRMLSRLLSMDGFGARGDLNNDIMSLRDNDNNIVSISSNIGLGGNNNIIITLNNNSKNQSNKIIDDINTIISSFIGSNKDLLEMSDSDRAKFDEFLYDSTRILFDSFTIENVITINI